MSSSTNKCSNAAGPQTASSAICRCDTFLYPQIISNPAGRAVIAYRFGDYLDIRRALLLARPGEVELAHWRPGAQGDLAVQMIEWWSYLGDVLGYYNERIANETYLRTAVLPESVQGLIRTLGYRPRPGIGATGVLAATITGNKAFTLPAGFQIQSKPGPGEQPQIFELTQAALVQPPDTIDIAPTPSSNLISTDGLSVLLQGVITSIKVGDQLLLLDNAWPSTGGWSAVTVSSVQPETPPLGPANTRILFQKASQLAAAPTGSSYRLLRNRQSAHVWQYNAGSVIQSMQVDLEAINRNIKVNDPLLISLPDLAVANQLQLVSIASYTEAIWYANAVGSNPAVPPPAASPAEPAIPIPHSRLTFQNAIVCTDTTTERSRALLLFDWLDVGTLIATPSATLSTASAMVAVTLGSALPVSMQDLNGQDVLLSDVNGNGVEAEATSGFAPATSLTLSNFSDPTQSLTAPFSLLFNLLDVTRGKTVTNEILGNGDATVAGGQEFVLQKSPLTYLLNPTSASGTEYSSTLQIWVDGVQWKEVPSFFGQSATARIFVTSEDQQATTHVLFGDGVNGARLPSGVNNVVAAYRYGSGGNLPAAGSLSVILQSRPGLKAVLNPVQVGGGADPDSPQQLRTYAPQSVLTFGRAISADDCETIAAQAPGVARARAYWSWDPLQQRMMVKIYVGDTANAVKTAKTALAGACDPNRPLQVLPANAVTLGIRLTLVIDPEYAIADVLLAATAALVDPQSGLFGTSALRIGQAIYESQIYQACLAVKGTIAIHDLVVTGTAAFGSDFRLNPGEGGFLVLPAANLTLYPEVSANAS